MTVFVGTGAPERVHTLWGKPIQAIACSDRLTAAITRDGELYTWGALPGSGAPFSALSSQTEVQRAGPRWAE